MTINIKNTFAFFCSIWLSVSVVGQSKAILFTPEEQEWIAAHPIIEFGYEPSWEPYELYENGTYNGIVGEYVKILAERTGITFTPIPDITWAESIEGLKNGTIKMVPCCAITPHRRTFLEFTDIYINDPLVIVTRKGYEYISELNDLVGKKVALPKNYYMVELIRSDYPAVTIIEKEDIQSCLEALTYGEVDAFIDNLGVVNFYMHHRGFTGIKIAAPTFYKDNGIALAVTKDWVILRDIAQKVFNSITPKEKTEIRQKWISGDFNYGVSWSVIVRWIIISAIIAFAVIGFLYYWNKTLRKHIQLRKASEHQLMESLIALKKQDNEKKVLLQEIHHRVKNNLQVVSSMMRLQANVNQDPAAVKTLHEAVERIKTIALIHEKIYQSPDLGKVCLEEYSSSLIEAIISNFSIPKNLQLTIHSKEVCISLDHIVPFALILNELVTNSIKYAFDNVSEPKIELDIQKNGGAIELSYSDNGSWKENPTSDNFGTSLIEIFTEQLDGTYELKKTPSGTFYHFRFFQDN